MILLVNLIILPITYFHYFQPYFLLNLDTYYHFQIQRQIILSISYAMLLFVEFSFMFICFSFMLLCFLGFSFIFLTPLILININ